MDVGRKFLTKKFSWLSHLNVPNTHFKDLLKIVLLFAIMKIFPTLPQGLLDFGAFPLMLGTISAYLTP